MKKNQQEFRALTASQLAAPQIIKVLVRHCQNKWWEPINYNKLAKMIGWKGFNNMGCALSIAADTLRQIAKESKRDIPVEALFTIVSYKDAPVSGDGYYKYFDKPKCTIDEKQRLLEDAIIEAAEYDWRWVLEKLYLV